MSFVFLGFPVLALAQGAETACTYGDMVRRVVVMTEPGVSVPCEVHYFKDTEAPGENQVLWSATQQAGYCEEKARELIVKLESSGWVCLETVSPDVAADVITETTEETGEAVDTGSEDASVTE